MLTLLVLVLFVIILLDFVAVPTWHSKPHLLLLVTDGRVAQLALGYLSEPPQLRELRVLQGLPNFEGIRV